MGDQSRKSDVEILRVVIADAFKPRVELRLVNHPLPGSPTNYQVLTVIEGEDPSTTSFPKGRARDVGMGECEEIIALAKKPVPAFVSDGLMGCDGVTYEVAFSRCVTGARFEWWVQEPVGWESLGEVVRRMSCFSAVYL